MTTTEHKKNLGGRPKKAEAERRCKQTNHRWTIAEDRFLRQQAKAAGLTVGEFVRRRALKIPVTPPPQMADAKLIHELNAIGVNINQIARNLNSARRGSAMDWGTVQRELMRVLEKVGASFK